ncbi:hypothetical protein M422DRAFT_35082, partial [Sphaerobolus stellatus SS14]
IGLWKLKDASRTRSRSQLNNENAVSRTYTFDHGRLGAGSEDTSGRFSSRPRFVEDLDTQPWAHVRRMWTWTRIGLGAVLLSWSTYCAVHYYIAVRVYDDDPVSVLQAFDRTLSFVISGPCTLGYNCHSFCPCTLDSSSPPILPDASFVARPTPIY